MAKRIREKEISSVELVTAHLARIDRLNPQINAVVEKLSESALKAARTADAKLAAGELLGPLHGVPFSIKDSIDVAGIKCTAGTLGRKDAAPAQRDATLVKRLRNAGAIPIAKTNLPDLLFSFESDNLIYGRTNNPYALDRTAGGSSGGEAALIASCGSPMGLGSDAFGSVRLPAAFCGIAGIKPTSGRLPRTGHVPPRAGWLEAVWQMGPMSRSVEDLILAMQLLAGDDHEDFTSPPVPLLTSGGTDKLRVAFFTLNGFVACSEEVQRAVRECAHFLAENGFDVDEKRPPGVEQVYHLEFAIAGSDGGAGIHGYLEEIGSARVHPLLSNFLDRMRPFHCSVSELAARWEKWDRYREEMGAFFHEYDAIVCPVYTQTALRHGESAKDENFHGFSYTMAWNMAGAPAATVRWSEADGLPINVQVVSRPWHDLLALDICRIIEGQSGGWRPPRAD